VKLRLVEPFSGMLAAPNVLLITGAPVTVTLALEVLPVPPLVELMVTLLFFTPAVVPVTFAVTVQLAPAATPAPLRLTEEEPATAVAVPLQVVLSPLGVATTNPAGKLSIKAKPVRVVVALGLWMVKVRLVVPFSGIVDAPKTFVMAGAARTVSVAEEVVPPAAVELMVTLLTKTPSVVALTFTVIVHAPAGRLALLKLTLAAPAVAVTVPPQELVTPGVAATTRPVGKASVKLASTVLLLGLLMLKDRVTGVPTELDVGLKLLVICTGPTIVMLAVTVC
jgi:hypothetical protein